MAAPSTTEACPQKRLVDILREAVETKNDGEERQLDWAGELLPLVTNEAVRERTPEDFGDWSTRNSLPLHLAVRLQPSVDFVRELVKAYPEAVREKDRYDRLPLHRACESDASLEVVAALRAAMASLAEASLQSYLDSAAAGDKDKKGRSALHRAVFEGAPVSVLTAGDKDDEGRSALHRAVFEGAPVSVLSAVMAARPEAVREKDRERKLPLHVACENKAPVEVVRLLVEAYPEAVREKDNEKKLPLHIACGNKAPVEVVRLLVEAYPEAVREKDKYGRLPLHLACENKAPLEVVRLLVEAYPEAVREKVAFSRNDGKNLLRDLAMKNECVNFDLLAALVVGDLPISFRHRDRVLQVEDHGYSWTFLIDHYKANPAVSKIIVEHIFREHFHSSPSHCLALAHAKTQIGSRAIDITNEQTRQHMHSYIFFCGRYELQEGPPVHRSATAVVIYAQDHDVSVEYAAVFTRALEADIAHRTANTNGELSLVGFRHALSLLDPSGSSLSQAKADEHFSSFDKNRSLGLSKEEFLQFAATHFGKERKVAIKFMRNEDQYLREKNTRSKFNLNGSFVVGLLDPPSQAVFGEQIAALMHDGRSLADYKFAVFMPAASRSLDAIFRSERPDLPHVKIVMREVAEALQHCHAQMITHGDVKALNALRVQDRISLIDMDAACVFDSQKPEVGDFIGSKFSSGTFPPEMFYELLSEEEAAYRAYWAKEAAADKDIPEQRADAELWAKIEPRRVVAKVVHKTVEKLFVVKTFRTVAKSDGEGSTYDEAVLDGLPYAAELVRASPDIDVWAFGCVLFMLCHGEPLLPVNRDDDLSRPEDMQAALQWTDVKLAARVGEIKVAGEEAVLVKDLLLKIFRREPADRLRSMGAVLGHVFFKGGGAGGQDTATIIAAIKDGNAALSGQLNTMASKIDAILDNTIELKDMSAKMAGQLHKTERVLLNAVVEGVDVTCPSCTLIVGTPYAYLGTAERQSKEEAEKAANARLSFMGSLMKMDLGGLKDAASAKAAMATEMALGAKDRAMGGGTGSMADGDCYYWYLVDEVKMQAVVPRACPHRAPSAGLGHCAECDFSVCCSHRINPELPVGHCAECNYPVKLFLKGEHWKETHKILVTVIPLMQLTLKAAKVYNVASGIANMVGYPTPKIPEK